MDWQRRMRRSGRRRHAWTIGLNGAAGAQLGRRRGLAAGSKEQHSPEADKASPFASHHAQFHQYQTPA
jgi:hypothetical protein